MRTENSIAFAAAAGLRVSGVSVLPCRSAPVY